MLWSLFVDSCCTSCLVASLRSDTLVFWQTAIAAQRSACVAHFCQSLVSSLQPQTRSHRRWNENARCAKSALYESLRESRLPLPASGRWRSPPSTPHETDPLEPSLGLVCATQPRSTCACTPVQTKMLPLTVALAAKIRSLVGSFRSLSLPSPAFPLILSRYHRDSIPY